MQYQLITLPDFQILGKGQAFEFDHFVKEGGQFWRDYVASAAYSRLMECSKGAAGAVTRAPLLSAYFPKEGRENSEFIDVLAIEATKPHEPSEFDHHFVPGGRYAEFECAYSQSMKTNRAIYRDWFAATGYHRDDTRPDLAAYYPLPFRPLKEMRMKWWIPVLQQDQET